MVTVWHWITVHYIQHISEFEYLYWNFCIPTKITSDKYHICTNTFLNIGLMRLVAGFYCLEGSTVLTPCPAGHFSPLSGISSISDCSPCPVGFFCNSSGLTEASGPCKAGSKMWYHVEEKKTSGSLHTNTWGPPRVLSIVFVNPRTLLFPGLYRLFSHLPILRRCLLNGTLLPRGQRVATAVWHWQLPPRVWSVLPVSLPPLYPWKILPESWSTTTNRWEISLGLPSW